MSKTLVQRIESFLSQHPEGKFTAKQIAEGVIELDPKWADSKKNNSKNPKIKNGTKDDLIEQVWAELGANKAAIEKNIRIAVTEDRPRIYFYVPQSSDIAVSSESDPIASTQRFYEQDLYPLLTKYMLQEHGVQTKRINESKSRNSKGPRGNEWLHPDLIGFEALNASWQSDIVDISALRGDSSVRLWSFEVKKSVSQSTVRQSFFQALANSSWANLAYLVAETIESKAADELRMLSARHGVGVIQLSLEDEIGGSIYIPATERREIDWSAANRLASENSDAADCFKNILTYYQTKGHYSGEWDEPPEID
ncbi:HrgA protein [Rhodobacterales bacterium HKCCSP123]|nr:HrgA protein [Rhodobacterales bacterium HKCCSP123]